MTARHMASPRLIVICGDDSPHVEAGAFDTPAAAKKWIDVELRCPGRHRIAREGVLILVGERT